MQEGRAASYYIKPFFHFFSVTLNRIVPCSLSDRWRPALGFAGGEKSGEDHCAWWQAKPRVPAHPGPAWVQILSLQNSTGRQQPCHPGKQGLWSQKPNDTLWISNVVTFKQTVRMSLPGRGCPVSGWYRCSEDRRRVSKAVLQWEQQHQNTHLCVSTYLGYIQAHT